MAEIYVARALPLAEPQPEALRGVRILELATSVLGPVTSC
jgi:hypothetical protein